MVLKYCEVDAEMMNINIAELGTDLGRQLPFAFTATAAELEALSDDYEFAGPIEVTGNVVYTGVRWRVSGKIAAVKTYVCNRCLQACREEQLHEFAEDFTREATEDDSINVFSGDLLDIEDLVRDTLLAAQSLSNICKPDCKGLCPKCGHNLNEGDCGCDRFVPDPRMAALQQLLKKD